ncbi:MAG: phosphoadenosine phosphosulfate reductase family protein [Rhodospirillales bacterium]|nr:phosphoadenosine phosphosulfate reductase family protein [Rhodospirillales bacterium]
MKLDSRIRRLPIPVPPECRALIGRGALFAISHSGGKDSQCMTILLSRIVPRDQILVVHAPLGEVEWPGTVEHIQDTIPDGVPFILAPVASGKSLLERIEERGMFPSASVRWCTSNFKRTPIERELRRHLKAHPRFGNRIVSAMGMRASESPARSKRAAWQKNVRNSKAGREWFDWLPIHGLETEDVFRIIRRAGQSPHWAYAAGMSRLSCSFCILASRADLGRAAQLRPNLHRRYAELEKRIGHTLSPMRVPLPELTGVPVSPCRHESAPVPANPIPALGDRGS